MGNRLSKIYTRTGDQGTTGLSDGSRVNKSSLRVHAMGDVDELDSLIGVLLTEEIPSEITNILIDIQHVLFDLGGELSIPGSELIKQQYVEQLEQAIDRFNEDLPPLKEFILPGGSKSAAICHLTRTVCRRAERVVVQLAEKEDISQFSRNYLNRLSDLLFVFARVLARRDGNSEIFWEKGRIQQE